MSTCRNVTALLPALHATKHFESGRCAFLQVVDLGGVSTLALLKHQRSPENQAEWQHNADFNPETMVRAPDPGTALRDPSRMYTPHRHVQDGSWRISF